MVILFINYFRIVKEVLQITGIKRLSLLGLIKLRSTDLKDLFQNYSPLTTFKHCSHNLGPKLLVATKFLLPFSCIALLLQA